MVRDNNRDIMAKNVSNVISSVKSPHHMSERVYDVDYTKNGDNPMEDHEYIDLTDILEETKLNIFKDDEERR